MDVTDHGHVPYVIILVHVLEKWKKSVSPSKLSLLISQLKQPL